MLLRTSYSRAATCEVVVSASGIDGGGCSAATIEDGEMDGDNNSSSDDTSFLFS
jgi:hypothetical protein